MRDLQKLTEIYSQFMEELGIDLKDPNATDTPKRVAKMFLNEFTAHLDKKDFEVTVFPNDQGYDQYVVVRNITYYSICAHHHVPFYGQAHIVYHPGKSILGLSKFARVVRHFSQAPQIQETLTKEIVDYLSEEIEPKGIYVMLTGRHMCMEARGIRAIGAETITSQVVGEMDKEEAIKLIGGK